MTFLIQWIANAISLYLLDILFDGITFTENKAIIITALILMFVNAIIKPILKLLSLPLTIVIKKGSCKNTRVLFFVEKIAYCRIYYCKNY